MALGQYRLEDGHVLEVGPQESRQVLFRLKLIFVLLEMLGAIFAFNQGIARQRPSSCSEPLFYVRHQVCDFTFGEMLNSRVPHDIVEIARWHFGTNIGNAIGEVWGIKVSLSLSDRHGVEIN